MNLDEARQLFDGGPDGVEEWNRRRAVGEPLPDLRQAGVLRSASVMDAIARSSARIVAQNT